MSVTASAAPCFFDAKLLGTRDPKTANVSPSTWVENLEMGMHAAIQLAQNLQSEMRAGAPTKETMHSLYERVLTLASAHESHPTNPTYSRAISEPLREACQATQSWYTGCFNPLSADADRKQVCPTPVAVNDLISKLKSLVAVDDDGNRAIDLAATAKPFIDSYNVSCKPAQVFTTPAELFEAGGPLSWMVPPRK